MHSDRLQRIIQLKERLLEEKEQILDQYKREIDLINNNIRELYSDIEVNYSKLYTNPIDGKDFVLLKDYLEYLGRVKAEALTRKDLVEKKIANVRSELLSMLKEIKMFDTLKDKILSSATGAQNKKHQKLLDNIALRLESRKI
jgi:flagellar export protein FliJ